MTSLPPDLRSLRPCFNRDGSAKVRFTQADAVTAAADMQVRHGSNRRPYRAYECGVCGAWHVGRKPAKGTQQRMKQRL